MYTSICYTQDNQENRLVKLEALNIEVVMMQMQTDIARIRQSLEAK
jgi:hypothetical protein